MYRLCTFDFQPDPEYNHLTTLYILAQGAGLRDHVVAFAHGGSLSDNPDFLRVVLYLKFMPVVERCIEMRHSLVKQGLGGGGGASTL